MLQAKHGGAANTLYIDGSRDGQQQQSGWGKLFAIADAAAIFPPIHFSRIRGQIGVADMVMGADFSATERGEKAFRLVGAALAIAIGNAVVDRFESD